ncbi:unnamed protein product [Amoebophrya sp. A25]|nr:unnamed protein product [Amoebophrya sp. A25]|eukprot:GSA25T00016209001.1
MILPNPNQLTSKYVRRKVISFNYNYPRGRQALQNQ